MRGRLGLPRPPRARIAAHLVGVGLLLAAVTTGCASHDPAVRVSKVGPLQTPFQLKMGPRVVGVRSVPTCSDASPDGYNSFHRAVRIGDTWIASGDDGRGNPGLSERAALWSWPGHGCWKRIGLSVSQQAGQQYIGGLVARAGTVYAAGADLGRYETDELVPQIWRSANRGSTWGLQKLALPTETTWGLVEDLVSLADHSLLAVGVTGDDTASRATVWRSADGGKWTPSVVPVSRTHESSMASSAVQSASGRLVMVGSLSKERYDVLHGGGGWVATWVSDDSGATWRRTSPGHAVFAYSGVLVGVTRAGGTIVAIGSTGTIDALRPDAWRSTDDGRTWRRVLDGLEDRVEGYGLFEISTVTPSTVVAVGYDAETDHDVVAALAGDRWVTSDQIASEANIQYIDDVVATTDGAMMFGRHERGGTNGDLQVAAVTIRAAGGS
jgi:hypothetical protein